MNQVLRGNKLTTDQICYIQQNYDQLEIPSNITKTHVKRIKSKADIYLSTLAIKSISSNGYDFSNPVDLGQGKTLIYRAKSANKTNLCAKVAAKQTIDHEASIGKLVTGPCVLNIIASFDIDSQVKEDNNIQRAAIVTIYYPELSSSLIYDQDLFHLEESLISLILCGLSAIYSFAKLSFCHCDIKPNNIVIGGIRKFILIDFGSVTNFNDTMKEHTDGMSFQGLFNTCIEYDISCLAVTVVKIMFKNLSVTFGSWDDMISRLNNFERREQHRISIKMLEMLKVDPNSDFRLPEFLNVWKRVYDFASNEKEFVKDSDFMNVQKEYR